MTRGDTGAPLADVTVIVRDAAPPFAELHRASTDVEGRYDLSPLLDGDVHLHFVSPEFAETLFGPFRISGGPVELSVDQVIPAVANRLRGRVVSETSGLPIEGVEIRRAGVWLAPPAISDRDGDFAIGGLPSGVQHLEFKRAGFPVLARPVRIDELRVTNETFTFDDQRVEVSGLVLEADGHPVAETELVLSRVPGEVVEEATIRTDSTGAFALKLPPGTWTARAGGRPFGSLSALDVTTVPPPFVLRARPPAPNRCVVLTSTGAPAFGAQARWLTNGRMTDEGSVAGDGTAEPKVDALRLLLAGMFVERAAAPRKAKPELRQFEAALNGETGRLTLTDARPCVLQLTAAVELTVRSPSAEGLSWVRYPVGVGDRSEAIWFSGSTKLSVPPGFQVFEFGSPLGLARVKVEVSGPTAVVAPSVALFSRPIR